MKDDKIFKFNYIETMSLILVYLVSLRAEYKYNKAITSFILELDEKMANRNEFFNHLINNKPNELTGLTTRNIESFYEYSYTPEYTDWTFIIAKAQKTLANTQEKFFLYNKNKPLIENNNELEMLKNLLLNTVNAFKDNKNFQNYTEQLTRFKIIIENEGSNISLLHRLMVYALKCEISLDNKDEANTFTFSFFSKKTSTSIFNDFCKILTGLFNTTITETKNKVCSLDKKISSLSQEDTASNNNANNGQQPEPQSNTTGSDNSKLNEKTSLLPPGNYGTFS